MGETCVMGDLELLTLHAIRLRGFSSTESVAARYSLAVAEVEEETLDQQALGRLNWSAFGSSEGWSLTDRGRQHGESLLAAQLDGVAGRARTSSAYQTFLASNSRLRQAVSSWQLRPVDGDSLAANDHRDAVWDAGVLAELSELSRALRPIVSTMESVLERFGGYATRFDAALGRAAEGDREWVDGVGTDSCHTVWFELHEDFLATLGLRR
jgi:hypothetical protein